MPNLSSRERFKLYQEEVAQRRHRESKEGLESKTDPAGKGEKAKARQRSFWKLLGEFWGQLVGHRGKVLFGLATLTISTLLGLLPPAGTKFAIDYVLTEPPKPIPDWLSAQLPSLSRMGLLWWIA